MIQEIVEIIKHSIEGIMLGFESGKEIKEKIKEEQVHEKQGQLDGERDPLLEKRESEDEEEKRKKASTPTTTLSYVKTAGKAVLDFILSKHFGRILLLASAVAMLVLTGPIGAGVAAGITVLVVAAGVSWEAYQRYKLRRLQNEDKALNSLVAKEHERGKTFLELQEKVNTLPLEKREGYETLLKMMSARHSQPTSGLSEMHKLDLKTAFGKSFLGTTPEALVGLGMSIATLNPLGIALSSAAALLRWRKEYRQNVTFGDKKADLLNHMEAAKDFLGISYRPGTAITELKMLDQLRDAELKALKEFQGRMLKKIEAGEIIDPKAEYKEYNKLREKYLKEVQPIKEETTGDKAKQYFKSMGEVLVTGFSEKRSEQLFDPLRRHTNPQHKIEDINHMREKEQELVRAREQEREKVRQQEQLRQEHQAKGGRKSTVVDTIIDEHNTHPNKSLLRDIITERQSTNPETAVEEIISGGKRARADSVESESTKKQRRQTIG